MVVFEFEWESEAPGGLIQTQVAGPLPKSSSFSMSVMDPKDFISSKFSADADAAGPGTTL